MRCSKKIIIVWWPNGDRQGEIPNEYKEALEESGFDRAFDMIKQGYQSGELNENIALGLQDEPEDGAEFAGWWSVENYNSDPE